MMTISRFNKILLASLFALFAASNCLAQNKVDLELTGQTAAKSVRGGESFTYTITVSNIGSAKATKVTLAQTEPKSAVFVSAAQSKGNCEIKKFEANVDRSLYCKLDDMEAGETILITVEMKVHDFGDISLVDDSGEMTAAARDSMTAAEKETLAAIRGFAEMTGLAMQSRRSSMGNVDVIAEESDENRNNNVAQIFVELLPSKNIPPRVKILSPQENAIITRHSKKLTTVTLTIQAFDPDGTIEEVVVRANQISPSGEHPLTHVIIRGKEYSFEELRKNPALLEQAEGGRAVKTGKDTYTYTIENPNYGNNTVQIGVLDNGGRSDNATVQFMVKGDNTIEFTNPIRNALIKPHTDISIETTCRLNNGKLVGLQLMGARLDGYSFASALDEKPMRLISAQGGVYRHQYVMKNAERGIYNLRVYLTEDSGAFTYSEDFRFTVSEKQTVKISVANLKRIFKEDENIPFTVEAAEADGEIRSVTVLVNGKDKNNNWLPDDNGRHQNGYFYGLSKGIYTITAKVEDDLQIESESEPLTIVVR